MISDEKELALTNFLLDIDCLQELSKWSDKFNIFDVLKSSRNEIRHSNMLAWLLDANENHGIGDNYIRHFFQYLVQESEIKEDVFKFMLLDFYSFSIYREWKNIDIMLLSEDEKVVVVIENKIGSHEHDNQLERYEKIIQDEYPNYKKIFIYLTPDGEEPSSSNWVVFTYETALDILIKICNSVDLLPDVKLLIDNYINTIRRDIVEDKELVEICNKIYNKHKKALDLIYEYRLDKGQLSETIKTVLQEYAKKGKIIFENIKGVNTYIRFYTPNMNKFLPDLLQNNGSWNDKHVYAYEFAVRKDSMRLGFVLALKNVPEATKQNMQKVIQITKPGNTKDTKKYRTIKSQVYRIEDNEEGFSEMKDTIDKAIKDILKWEDSLLKKIV